MSHKNCMTAFKIAKKLCWQCLLIKLALSDFLHSISIACCADHACHGWITRLRQFLLKAKHSSAFSCKEVKLVQLPQHRAIDLKVQPHHYFVNMIIDAFTNDILTWASCSVLYLWNHMDFMNDIHFFSAVSLCLVNRASKVSRFGLKYHQDNTYLHDGYATLLNIFSTILSTFIHRMIMLVHE